MNEISAAEAVKLFDAAMGIKVKHDPYNIAWLCPNPSGFPKDIAAKDFMESLKLYREMWLESIEFSAARQRVFAGLYAGDYDEQRSQLANAAISKQDVAKLTPKELEVFNLLKEDLGDKEIAIKLNKGVGTIKAQVSSVLRKLGFKSRTQASTKVRTT